MPEPSLFRHYQIVQDGDGNNVELLRNPEQVAVLAFDTQLLEFVHCHVLLEPLGQQAQAFQDNARHVQQNSHPLLARLIDFGEDEGNPFYITSNVDGETLHSYLSRQQDLPAWLAAAIACRAMEAMIAVAEKGDTLADPPQEALRILQTGPHTLQVQAADFRLLSGSSSGRALRPAFDKQAKQLRTFLQEHDNPLLPDHPLRAADFTELLEGCLVNSGAGVVAAMRELRATLLKLIPEHVSGEIATANKPRSLLAPQLASYQEVARTVVNLVRIQSQRLDMANPYAMRGTLTKTGRSVMVEQVPPDRLCGNRLRRAYDKASQVTQKRQSPGLIGLSLLHESEGVVCMAEEIVEGLSLADLLRERRYLNAKETYLVLAGLDAALSQLEAAALDLNRLRLEDIFLLTGFPREDTRSAKLMLTKLTEWPAFSLMLRGHPTLAALAGRGLDPAVLLSSGTKKPGGTPWQGAWLAALSRFLLALDAVPGIHATPQGGARERDTLARLTEEEMQKAAAGKAGTRGDFLARYARMIQHHELVKPLGPPSGPLAVSPVTASVEPLPRANRAATIPITRSGKEDRGAAAALTGGSVAAPVEKPTVGFAEVLFRGTSEGGGHVAGPDWAKTAEDAPPTIHPGEALLPPRDYVPLWLRSAVFLGGSLILGALLAHLSGEATWQRNRKPAFPAATPARAIPSAVRASTPPGATAVPASPAAAPTVRPADTPALPPAPTLPPERPTTSGGLEMRPPSSLKDLLIEPSGPPAAK